MTKLLKRSKKKPQKDQNIIMVRFIFVMFCISLHTKGEGKLNEIRYKLFIYKLGILSMHK